MPTAHRSRAARRVLARTTVLGMVMAILGVSAGITSASAAPHRQLRPGAQAARGSGLTLARAPAGLRAAVRRTLSTPAAAAATWSQQAKLTASDGTHINFFGFAVAISGSTAVVGAYGKKVHTGAAYVFVRSGSTWSQQAKLTAAGGVSEDEFGYSVALSGSTAVLGAPGVNSSTGAAYVFVRSGSTWSQQAKLTAAGGVSGEGFGYSVALSGSTAVVGATGASPGGAAYVFVRSGTTWSQQAKLTGAGVRAGAAFGESVGVSGDTAVVGAGGGPGAAYVFVRSGTTWSQQAKLTAAVPRGDFFGYSVAVSGDTALVSCYALGPGAVFVFVRSGTTWSQQAKLTAAGVHLGVDFGASVALSGDTAVVGATNSPTGEAFVFVRSGTTWSQQAKLTAADGAIQDVFGFVAVSGSTAVVGAPDKSTFTGAAYVFVRV